MTDPLMYYVTWAHLLAATTALLLGMYQLLANPKGDAAHKRRGWFWVALMLLVTVPSFWMRGINGDNFSWIHGLSLLVLFCLVMAIFSIRKGKIRRHAAYMTGTLIGIALAGLFALLPGRFISEVLGYTLP